MRKRYLNVSMDKATVSVKFCVFLITLTIIFAISHSFWRNSKIAHIITVHVNKAISFQENIDRKEAETINKLIDEAFHDEEILFASTNDSKNLEKHQKLDLTCKNEKFNRVMQTRLERIQKNCDALKISPKMMSLDDLEKIIYFPEFEVLWCPVFKAGSTTWLFYLFDLTAKVEEVN